MTLFYFFRSLLNISCIFSVLVSRLFICNSILFSRFWIIFIIIILKSFSGRFPISSSFVRLGGHFSCSFVWWVFLCLFILFSLLCFWWPFCILVVCGSFLFWRFLPVGGVGWLASQGFLVREAYIHVLVGGTGFLLLECSGVSSSEFLDGSMGLLWLWAACILMLRATFLHCWRICMVCLALAHEWWLVSVWVWRLLDDLLLISVPCSQEFSGVLRF